MKKRIFCVLIAGVLLFGGLAGCAKTSGKAEPAMGENLLAGLAPVVTGGVAYKDGFQGGAGVCYTAAFPEAKQVNTLVLREKESIAQGFVIEAEIDGVFQTIYEQDDKIGSYRY